MLPRGQSFPPDYTGKRAVFPPPAIAGWQKPGAPFVAFLDQDDMLHPQALEILYRMICRDGADVSAFKIRFVPDNFAGDPAPERFDAEEVVRDAVFSRARWRIFSATVKVGRFISGTSFTAARQLPA